MTSETSKNTFFIIHATLINFSNFYASGKLWKNITKNDLGEFNEENWLIELGWIIDAMVNTKLIIIRLIFGDPLVTPLVFINILS